MLKILSVAYCLGVVGPDASGGSEQILRLLDEELVSVGIRSLVLAIEGSVSAGELIPVRRCRTRVGAGGLATEVLAAQQARHRYALEQAIAEHGPDLIHMHGLDFHAVLPKPGVPTLVTLHCPHEWYPRQALRNQRIETYFNSVSRDQHSKLSGLPNLIGPIENGIRVEGFFQASRKVGPPLFLGRIAPEKGLHFALAACHSAGLPLTIAGPLEAYPAHKAYFETHVRPQIDSQRRWVGPVGFNEKRKLLAEACCLLVCSEAEETSSLAAREALASGTPVVAFRRGALRDTIEHGRTGLLVDSADDLAAALHKVGGIEPEACRTAARERFDARRMAADYIALYRRLASRAAGEVA